MVRFFVFALFSHLVAHGEVREPELPSPPTPPELNTDSFFDPSFDYSHFPGRVTDRNGDNTIFKILTENSNIRFFKSGDKLTLKIPKKSKGDRCRALVRGVEKNYLILFIPEISNCLGRDHYFRRGTLLKLHSDILHQRVLEASRYRRTLLAQKRDFLEQLNEVNNFLWSFDQSRVKSVAQYDREILQLEKEKEQALEFLASERKEKMHLQEELVAHLEKIKQSLSHYRVSKPELLQDRWSKDHDLALPVGPRPLSLKDK